MDVIDGDQVDDRRGDDQINAALADGKCVVFYEFDWRTATVRYQQVHLTADVWYTERNGDPITCLAPKGTPKEQLPKHAKGYMVFRWATPEEY